jgi:hypothetical protein
MQLLDTINIAPMIGGNGRREGDLEHFMLDYIPLIRALFSRYWSLHRYRLIGDNPPFYVCFFSQNDDRDERATARSSS